MKRLPIFFVAGLFAAAVSAPAQGHSSRFRIRTGAVSARASHGYAPILRSVGYSRHRVRIAPAARGCWRTVTENVLVEPGYWRTEWIEPTYGWVYDGCGRRSWGIVAPGCERRIWCPPRYETRTRRVWVGLGIGF